MLPLFVATIFTSAALLFLVQPMAAKLVLPLLGGSPAVWTTCMLFFQALLLGGYLYGHLVTRYLSLRRQVIVHALVIAAAAASLPLGLPAGAGSIGALSDSLPRELTIVIWLLMVLGMAVGAPFFVVSTTGPLLQRWFSNTQHVHARDPYFLYAASNLGSMIGLLAYPLVMEPLIGVHEQGVVWGGVYAVFGLLALAAGVLAIRGSKDGGRAQPEPIATGGRLPWKRRLKWLALATIPSSLMLGVTQQIATDLASVPLLWIIPLGLYLLTFIAAFSPKYRPSSRILSWCVAILIPTVLVTMMLAVMEPLWYVITLHFAAFFASALMCHTILAEDRPSPEHLTEFFLIMAAGGVLGGLFNSILAPLVFNDVYEYPIAMIAALILRPREPRTSGDARVSRTLWSLVLPLLSLVCLVAIAVMVEKREHGGAKAWTTFDSALPYLRTVPFLLLALFGIRRVPVFASCIAIFAGSMYATRALGISSVVYQERSFFGVVRVIEQLNGGVRFLSHGTTTHGAQIFVDDNVRLLPTTYYHPTGPVGQLYSALGNDPRLKSVAVIGLGTGSIAAYAQPSDKYTFYEIDNAVMGIATGKTTPRKYFSYINDSLANLKIIIADGRLGLEANAQDGEYGLIVVDAFSSDSIPVHLLTKEAFEIYLKKLMPDGIVLVHISNRHFDLVPVIKSAAESVGCECLYNDDHSVTAQEQRLGKTASRWLAVARTRQAVLPLMQIPDSQWTPVTLRKAFRVWTDDYSNVLKVLR